MEITPVNKIQYKILIIKTTLMLTALLVSCFAMIGSQLLPIPLWAKSIAAFAGLLPVLAAILIIFRIEQKMGKFHCEVCGCKHIPPYMDIATAEMLMDGTRYMQCPKCNNISWQKKVDET